MKLPEDPFILELLPEFLEEWLKDMDTKFPEILKARNADDLYRLGHTLKGSCFQFGLDETAQLGIELMGYARSGDWEKAAALYTPLVNGFKEMKAFLEAEAR
ncbi:MAG TPA: Hpt domain-containing protein [Patescibacteria group bacterium]|nr:Hpt domain-containing protein [Patescibacteria group bacterium]